MKRFVAISLAALIASILVAGCQKEGAVQKAQLDPAKHREEILQWQKQRAERLKAEDGWLSLVGLFWLSEGENRFGSAQDSNELVLPADAPAVAGTLVKEGRVVTLRPVAPMTIDGKPVSEPVTLMDDSDPNGPTVVRMGTIRFQIIKRGDHYGLRVKDSEAHTRTHFLGLDYFPIDPKWRIEARFEPYEPMKKIPINDVTGLTTDNDSPGALVFTVDGKEYRIDPVLEEGTDDLFIIFKDETSRDTTYPSGRFLYAPKPGPDGIVVVDFNKAYNPPCTFTPFATCPLPPPENRLPFRIEAGEKRYRGGHGGNTERGTRNAEHGTRNAEHGTRNAEHGTLNTEP